MDCIPYPMEEETYACTCNDICACPIKNELKAIEYDLNRAMENDEQDIKSIEYNIFKSPNPDEQDRKTVQSTYQCWYPQLYLSFKGVKLNNFSSYLLSYFVTSTYAQTIEK